MKVQQHVKEAGAAEWSKVAGGPGSIDAQLALVFGSNTALREPMTWDALRALHPCARIVACSTAGEISGTRVLDDGIVVTSLAFERSRLAIAAARIDEAEGSLELGRLLASRLPHEELVHVVVLSHGLKVNGSALVNGIIGTLPQGVAITGGLAGDGSRFERTSVCLDGPEPTEQVVAIGLYGGELRVGYGSLGGWDPFGPERRITKSEGNILYELDGAPALDLYKRYLAEQAADLPASGLLFPLTIRSGSEDSTPVVRTILGVDEVARTLTFAGDVPIGYRARLMRANFERLVDGACGAARICQESLRGSQADLALLISCVGRKLVLKQRIEEEVEGVLDVLGTNSVLAGFYSYGEISPFTPTARCELHNQTMTITTLSER